MAITSAFQAENVSSILTIRFVVQRPVVNWFITSPCSLPYNGNDPFCNMYEVDYETEG